MLKLWNFKNTFTNKLLPYSYSYLNNNYVSQKKKDFNLCYEKTVYSNNTEIINHYISFIDQQNFHSSIEIEENNWKYPFPHGYIPDNSSKICTNISFRDKSGNLTDTIQEHIHINIHKPSPYQINGKYYLCINNNKIVDNISYEIPMDFKEMNLHKFTNHLQFEKFMNKLKYYLKN